MACSLASRRHSTKSRIQPAAGFLRFGSAILASVAICIWPAWAGICCCHTAASVEIAPDLPPCCRATEAEDRSEASPPGCCSLAPAECSTCEGVKHECPCEVRDQNLDRWVGTRLAFVDAPESDQDANWLAYPADVRRPFSVSATTFLSHDGRPFLTAIDRCALLCRWLN